MSVLKPPLELITSSNDSDIVVQVKVWQKKQGSPENSVKRQKKKSSINKNKVREDKEVLKSCPSTPRSGREPPNKKIQEIGTKEGRGLILKAGQDKLLQKHETTPEKGSINLEVPDIQNTDKGYLKYESKWTTKTDNRKKTEAIKYSQKWKPKKTKKSDNVKYGKKTKSVASQPGSSTSASVTRTKSRDPSADFTEPTESSIRIRKRAGEPSADGTHFLSGTSSRDSDRAIRKGKRSKHNREKEGSSPFNKGTTEGTGAKNSSKNLHSAKMDNPKNRGAKTERPAAKQVWTSTKSMKKPVPSTAGRITAEDFGSTDLGKPGKESAETRTATDPYSKTQRIWPLGLIVLSVAVILGFLIYSNTAESSSDNFYPQCFAKR